MNRDNQFQSEWCVYIGSHSLVGFEGEIGEGEARLKRYAILSRPEGFVEGGVSDLEGAAASIEKVLEAAGAPLGPHDMKVTAVFENSKLMTRTFSSSIYFQGSPRTVTAHEIRAIISQTRNVSTLPLSEVVLQAVPDSFLVNDMPSIRNPLGLEAQRLGVNLRLFTMDYRDFRNLSHAFEAAEIEVKGFVPKNLVISEAVLSEEEKNEGVVVIDIGTGFTEMSLWHGGNLLDHRILSLGVSRLGKAVADKWEIDPLDAQKVLEKYGSLAPELSFGEELIPLVERGGNGYRSIHRQLFHEVFLEQFKAWIQEVLSESEVFSKSSKVMYPHYVWTGEVSNLEGLVEYLQKQFSRVSRLGSARKVEAVNEVLVNPLMIAPLGLLRWLSSQGRDQKRLITPTSLVEKTFASAREWLSSYF